MTVRVTRWPGLFFRYRGLVIRSLKEEINMGDNCSSDFVIAGILMLLLVDVS